MARVVNREAHAARRNAILDAAERAIATRGYEQMAMTDLHSQLGISSGAFYHYFDSKSALLAAVVERMGDLAEQAVLPVMRDPALGAVDRLNRFFSTLDRVKLSRKALLLEFMRAWYADDNAIVRHKVYASRVRRFAPLLEEIIRQGVGEGVFSAPYPEQTARIILALLDDLGFAVSELLLGEAWAPDALPALERIAAATADALERTLGAPPGALQPSWGEVGLEQWLAPPAGAPAG
jgi:TetR/AcrR family transcriptional repressor of nem operon